MKCLRLEEKACFSFFLMLLIFFYLFVCISPPPLFYSYIHLHVSSLVHIMVIFYVHIWIWFISACTVRGRVVVTEYFMFWSARVASRNFFSRDDVSGVWFDWAGYSSNHAQLYTATLKLDKRTRSRRDTFERKKLQKKMKNTCPSCFY